VPEARDVIDLMPTADYAAAIALSRPRGIVAGYGIAPGQGERGEFPSQREVTALRQLVTEMRRELQESRAREKYSRHLAFHDDLTALPNRRYFRDRLHAAVTNEGAHAINPAVIYLDLDGFKTLNDTFGHDVGDRVLSLMAARLAHAVRADDLVSRLGGDEFACLITGVPSRERLFSIGRSLFDAVSTPFKVGSHVLTVRPSIGIAVFPFDGMTTDALMQAADAGMYAAKRKRWVTSLRSVPASPLRAVATPANEASV